jgi:predicted RNase H-like nuclease
MCVAGVDGWRGRWLVATIGAGVEWALADSAAEVVELTRECAAVAVDVPMGLSDGPAGRACDALAKKLLPGAASSVFPAPLRPTLAAATHADAVRLARAVHGGAPSIQAWSITPGIRDWDDVLAACPELQRRVVEAHPEVSFRALLPAERWARKSTARGAGQRIAALGPWVDAAAALATVPAGPALDDALDALACTWTAHRWAAGTARTLPDEPPSDARGLAVRIVF